MAGYGVIEDHLDMIDCVRPEFNAETRMYDACNGVTRNDMMSVFYRCCRMRTVCRAELPGSSDLFSQDFLDSSVVKLTTIRLYVEHRVAISSHIGKYIRFQPKEDSLMYPPRSLSVCVPPRTASCGSPSVLRLHLLSFTVKL